MVREEWKRLRELEDGRGEKREGSREKEEEREKGKGDSEEIR